MNIVFLVFGKIPAYHLQTYFAILTVLKQKKDNDSVTIYTDYPEFYKRIGQLINIICFDQATLKEWVNGTGYIFRAKIKAIEMSARNRPDTPLLFLDGDTVMYQGLEEIKQLLDNGEGIMYTDEGHPSAMKGKSLNMWNAVKGMKFGDCQISMRHNVWNSGVIGIPAVSLSRVISLALEICDAFLQKNIKCFTIEQYAFAIAMQETCNIHPATQWIGHYWGNKDMWSDAIHDIVLQAHLKGLSIEEEIDCIDIKRLKNIPLFVKKSNTRRRLINLIDKLFKQ